MSGKTLQLLTVASTIAAPHSGPWRVALGDPARSVMTDFNEKSIVRVPPGQQVDEALEAMRHAGVRSAFVIDAERDLVLGLITAYDIMGEKPIRHLQTVGGSREDVVVSDIMDPADDWQVTHLDEVDHATVGVLLDTFAKLGRTHLPVVEGDSHKLRLRGLFSAAKVLRLTEAARRAARK
jgi:CBS domain-containing protein